MGEVMRCTRIIRTDDDGSAFEDAEVHLSEQQVARGTPPLLVGHLSSGSDVVFPSRRPSLTARCTLRPGRSRWLYCVERSRSK
jgi:hypothetical protein